MKAAIYARVSTSEDLDRQDPETQLVRLRDWAKALGLEVHKEYVDRASGADTKRPAIDRMLRAVRTRKVDTILIVRLDRIMRSTKGLLDLLEYLKRWGVGLRCLDQPIDTDSPEGDLILTIIAAVAQYERELVRARVRDGMARAKKYGTRSGKPIGRPRNRFPKKLLMEAQGRLDVGEPFAAVARSLGVPRTSLRRALTVLKGGTKTRD